MDGWPLLEIGCGRGIVVEHLRGRGTDCVGCELAAVSVLDHLRGIVLDRTDFADLPTEQRGRIRRAMLCDVIEHLPEPLAFLRKVRGALPALEGVLVTVPARQDSGPNGTGTTDISGGMISPRFAQYSTRLGSSRCSLATSSMAFTCPASCSEGEDVGRSLSKHRRFHGFMQSSAWRSELKKSSCRPLCPGHRLLLWRLSARSD